jgi:hypothetical protein
LSASGGRGWAQRAARKVGEFMVEREDENDILTDDEQEA